MNDEVITNDIRRFLKKVGIQSHQAIENAIREGLEQGKLNKGQQIVARVQLTIEEIPLALTIDGKISPG